MDDDTSAWPFDLRFRRDEYRCRWEEEKVWVSLAGTEDGPSPPHAAALRDVVERWPEVQRAIQSFCLSFGEDGHVPLDPPSLGGFRVSDCGFDDALLFSWISAVDPEDPRRVRVDFCTGLPDGYVTYRVIVVDGAPVSLDSFAS